MTKPTIVANSDAMPGGKPAAWFGRWIVFFRGDKEPEVMLANEVEVQAEINRQTEERRKGKR